MNAFVRQLAVLSMLWSLCELLLPDGKQQRLVRMTVSVLVMAALITALSGFFKLDAVQELTLPAMAEEIQTSGEQGYQKTALYAIANQAQGLCVRMANKAGYAATATVYLTQDGALDHIELCVSGWLAESSAPLMSENELLALIIGQLQVEESRVWLISPTDGAMER